MTTNEQLEALKDAFVQAFPSEMALQNLLLGIKIDGKDKRLEQVTKPGSLEERVYELIVYLNGHGTPLLDLIVRACELRPHNPDLAAVVRQHWPGLLPTPGPEPPPPAPAGDHEAGFWRSLIGAIRSKKCTPVIGPGLCHGVLPEDSEIVDAWAARSDDPWRYPFTDRADLTRVSQFVALTNSDPLAPHKDIAERYAKIEIPDIERPDDPHAVLADLELPLYLTTSYHNFMLRALERRRVNARRAFPCWNEDLRMLEPPEAAPVRGGEGAVVYHLFGHHELPESMVLTEDDCLRFLANVVENMKDIFPPAVNKAIGGTTLLFCGFRTFDLSFRVLVHTLLHAHTAKTHRQFGVAVQLAPGDVPDAQRGQVSEYLEKFLGQIGINVSVSWLDPVGFMRELRVRWDKECRHAVAS
jgi:hypothetical protein